MRAESLGTRLQLSLVCIIKCAIRKRVPLLASKCENVFQLNFDLAHGAVDPFVQSGMSRTSGRCAVSSFAVDEDYSVATKSLNNGSPLPAVLRRKPRETHQKLLLHQLHLQYTTEKRSRELRDIHDPLR